MSLPHKDILNCTKLYTAWHYFKRNTKLTCEIVLQLTLLKILLLTLLKPYFTIVERLELWINSKLLIGNIVDGS